jgi:hypothetical protein
VALTPFLAGVLRAWLAAHPGGQHLTEEMRKRYRHLIPSTEQAAIQSVFGEGP